LKVFLFKGYFSHFAGGTKQNFIFLYGAGEILALAKARIVMTIREMIMVVFMIQDILMKMKI